jgi:hypothetical protein
MDEFKDIVEVLKRVPNVEPPPDFTGRVADAIEAGQRDRQPANGLVLPQPVGPFADLEQGRSCPFWFIMAGFCYVTMGILLFFGLGRIGSNFTLAGWIAVQPQIAVTVGIIFFALGLLLFHEKMIVLKAVQRSLFLYIGFVVVNGVGMQIKLGVPATVALFLFYIGCGVGLGFFLHEAVHRYQQQLNHAT